MDVLFINPGNANGIYQKLSNKYSAIEPPTWSLLLAESCRSVGYEVGILDVNAETLSHQEVVDRINELAPRLVCFVVYGQNVNAGTVNMAGATSLSTYMKNTGVDIPISYIGSHIQALPIKTLQEDFKIQSEGLLELQQKNNEIELEMTRYLDIFKRHNLTKLAIAKPNLIETRVNNGTKKAFDSIEGVSRTIDGLDDNLQLQPISE